MPKPENELEIRDEQRDLGAELLASVRAVKAGQVGKVHLLRVSAEDGEIEALSFSVAAGEFLLK